MTFVDLGRSFSEKISPDLFERKYYVEFGSILSRAEESLMRRIASSGSRVTPIPIQKGICATMDYI